MPGLHQLITYAEASYPNMHPSMSDSRAAVFALVNYSSLIYVTELPTCQNCQTALTTFKTCCSVCTPSYYSLYLAATIPYCCVGSPVYTKVQ